MRPSSSSSMQLHRPASHRLPILFVSTTLLSLILFILATLLRYVSADGLYHNPGQFAPTFDANSNSNNEPITQQVHRRHRLLGANHKPLAPHARTAHKDKRNRDRRLRDTTTSEECTIIVIQMLVEHPGSMAETIFGCELDPSDASGVTGLTLDIKTDSNDEMQELHTKFKKGEIISGKSKLNLGKGAPYNDKEIFVPPGRIKNGIVKNLNSSGNNSSNPKKNRPAPWQRNLNTQEVSLVGTKPILVVRVTDSTGLVHEDSPSIISDNVFGVTSNDDEEERVNLKSQLEACSHGLLNVTAGLPTTSTNQGTDEDAPGVVNIQIPIALQSNSRTTIRNAITIAAQEKLGFDLPGPYEHVMYILEGCYYDCGWLAYAYVNSWNSVYQGRYYAMTSVLMHELGHNFNLAHSGGMDGGDYSDHTGVMGNPLFSENVGKMCFNAAKNWQLPWYNADNGKKLESPSIQLIDTFSQPVTVKLETGTDIDFFIGFNRAVGPNSHNDEASDQVTVTTSGNNGEGYSQSYLKATLKAGESYTIEGFGGSEENLVIKAVGIDTSASPGVATVCVAYGGGCDITQPTPPTVLTPPSTPKPVAGPPSEDPVIVFESIAPVCESFVPYDYDSGFTRRSISAVVSHDGAPWIQLKLDQTQLAKNAKLVITGEQTSQEIDDDTLEMNEYSAVFAGSSVTVQLIPRGFDPSLRNLLSSRVIISASALKVGMCDDGEAGDTAQAICYTDDDRTLSQDVRVGRIGGCTGFLISENVFIRAGHCGNPGTSTRMHFLFGDNTQTAPVEDQYAIDLSTYKMSDPAAFGDDWAAGRFLPNDVTGKLPGVAQSEKCGSPGCGWFSIGDVPTSLAGNNIRITGYGQGDAQRAQTTHVGPLHTIASTYLKYTVDTTGGNSGSPVINDADEVVGVHTHAGCTATGNGNAGTRIDFPSFREHIEFLTKTCNDDGDCDDGVFCDGVETCDANQCQFGTPLSCDDGLACTDDICNEAEDTCEHTPITTCPAGSAQEQCIEELGGCQPAPGTIYLLACGSSSKGCAGQTLVAQKDESHEVRCCSDTNLGSGWVQQASCVVAGFNVWGESEISGVGCVNGATHDEATQMCASMQARLCTADELLADCTRGSGCNHDSDMIWSSTDASITATTPEPTVEPTPNPTTANPTPEPTTSPTYFGQLPKLVYAADNGSNAFGSFPLQECQGDCDTDSDCTGELYCFERGGLEAVPGCSGEVESEPGKDYCAAPASTSTAEPTPIPTANPTAEPTPDPTPGPTAFPTPGPSASPTNNPTKSTTAQPTNEPTNAPNTAQPTNAPTAAATPSPTNEPTPSPTFNPTNFPTSQPTNTPTTPVPDTATLRYIGNNGGPGFPLGLCEGDCDSDEECTSPLRCFERSGYDPIPNCEGEGTQSTDYCTMRIPENLLWDKKNNLGSGQYGKCEGDCDRNSDCIGDLVCFKRSRGSLESIPGCAGQGQPGDDYCYDPNDR